jgi:hypothetical protein
MPWGAVILAGLYVVAGLLRCALWRNARAEDWQRQARFVEHEGLIRLSISREGIEYVTADRRHVVKWAGILYVALQPPHAFFAVSEYSAYVLPARAFASDDEFRGFVDLARKYKEGQPSPVPPDAITRRTDFTS